MSRAESKNQTRIDGLVEKVKEFPTTPGVYLMKNAAEKIIYVGKAKSLRNRVRSYFHKSAEQSLKTIYLVRQIQKIDFILTHTEVEAFLLEASLIKKHRPRYNIRLKDDKAYPYIKAAMDHPFPRFYVARKVVHDGSFYFGPYTSGLAVRETIRFLNRAFQIRDCKDGFMKSRSRPCMTYQIGRCTAPCVDLITEKAYGLDIKSALQFLKGRDKQVIRDLEDRMKEASEKEQFEAAARWRDSLKAVQKIWERQAVVATDVELDQDVVAFAGGEFGTLIEIMNLRSGRVIGRQNHFLAKLNPESEGEDVREWLPSFLNLYYLDNYIPDELILSEDLGRDVTHLLEALLKERGDKKSKVLPPAGEKAKKLVGMAQENAKAKLKEAVSQSQKKENALLDIQQKFHLPQLPFRMECFDISNFQGSQSVASQVVFENGVPKKEDYRRYKIKTVVGANDFASMKEVLFRRFQHTEYDSPQLVVVDGGKGQLKMAQEALAELELGRIPLVGLAKARSKRDFKSQDIASSEERFFLPGRQNPVILRSNTEAYRILVSLRDEAHRFAITYHRKLRDKNLIQTSLTDVPGLGPDRSERLLKVFGSVKGVLAASPEELCEVPGVSLPLAEKILDYLAEN